MSSSLQKSLNLAFNRISQAYNVEPRKYDKKGTFHSQI